MTVIDVTQALGWKTVDLGWADVTVAAVYKWLLAPRGTAWMSLSDRVVALDDAACRELVRGRAAVVDDLRAAAAAGRGCATVRRVADVVQRAGRGADAAVAGVAGPCRSRGACRRAGQPGARRTPSAAAEFGDRLDSDRGCRRQAAEQAGIRASMRAGAVRVGFHLYNTEDDLDRLLDVLR